MPIRKKQLIIDVDPDLIRVIVVRTSSGKSCVYGNKRQGPYGRRASDILKNYKMQRRADRRESYRVLMKNKRTVE